LHSGRATLSKNDSDRQIAQMIAFIKQEAREKAEEIEQRTEAEFQAEKLNRIRALARSIREDVERKKKDKTISKKIEHSRRITEARTKKMRERDNIIKQVKNEILEKLVEVSKNSHYSELIKFLIIQGLMTIAESHIILQCRKEDLDFVGAQLDGAVKSYQEFVLKATGVSPKCEVEINKTEFLPPSPRKGVLGLSCCGGVVLSARNGTIVCRNTLDSRLDLCFESLVPQVRGLLFGIRSKPKAKVVEEPTHH